ncbi:nuclear transport factor 2 family protein [Nocardiopsis sp. NPDC006198]|uniref:nuclear transport factor 2 family protein n=1 Tax=Nocardiopsis sp. NPDC006198 TaxID=3154472 RepID=UPI0033A59798
MSTRTETDPRFDGGALTRAVESADADAMLALFADDAEMEMIDKRAQPSRPAVLHGKAAIAPALREVFSRDMTHEVLDCVVDADHAAYTERCSYPDGTRVMSMTMLDLRDGRISHQSTVQAWDEPAAPRPETGDFARAEETEVLDRARTEALRVGGHTAVRMTLRPGWRWTVDMAESRGTAKCMANHRAYVVSGALRWQMDDGTEGEVHAGQVVCLPPNHDAWVLGDEPVTLVDWPVAEG